MYAIRPDSVPRRGVGLVADEIVGEKASDGLARRIDGVKRDLEILMTRPETYRLQRVLDDKELVCRIFLSVAVHL
jgi:hypothetical protein